MGNESSHLSGLEINDKAIEITDFWAHYQATVNDSGFFFNLKGYGSISVFKSESAVLGPLWSTHTPLEKCAISLMKYRHPWILRYVWHWQQRGVQWLATEPVQPLTQTLATQDPVQLCVGLHQVAKALDFLHTTATSSHNNVSIGAIYVLEDGSWRLGGMEFLRSFKEMTPTYLKQTRKYRYGKAVDPDEDSLQDLTRVDQYAFCTLVDDVFKGRKEEDVPHLVEFRAFCRQLQSSKVDTRPSFSCVLDQPLLGHDFISVCNFLSSLPLMRSAERAAFFSCLVARLRAYPQATVAQQLSAPLLSRLVLLDPTARDCLLPQLLLPRPDDCDDLERPGLFSLTIFKQYISPHLLKMFRVRDVQVRLLLLKYFPGFYSTFSHEDLTTHVLPELLLGIKDTCDSLVSMTLYCLADLVPVLGATAVIGGQRTKLFADGTPLHHPLQSLQPSPAPRAAALQRLHERPSPDGGEDPDTEVGTRLVENDFDGSDGNWSDWNDESGEAKAGTLTQTLAQPYHPALPDSDTPEVPSIILDEIEEPKTPVETVSQKNDSGYLQNAAMIAKSKKLTDISELDIKNQMFKSSDSDSTAKKDEFNFFTDMEPVIEKPSVLDIASRSGSNGVSSKLTFAPLESEERAEAVEGGWGDATWDED